MSGMLLIIVLVASALLLVGGLVFTLRGFRAADRPPVEVRPKHARSTDDELKHFFVGKACAVCSRPIAPVRAGEPRPGLLNPKTHDAIAWDAIPDVNLSTTLESHVPICSNCLITESLRGRHPELFVDRHRTAENPSH